MSATDSYLSNNSTYVAGFSKGAFADASGTRDRDRRVHGCPTGDGGFARLTEGEAHVIRNAGGVVTDDVIRSLTISQRLLGTREIMLIHHTDCGMLTFKDGDVKDAIKQDTGIRPPFAMEAFSDLEDDVRQSIARIKASPFVPHKDAIRGFVYEVETGCLREVK